MSNQTRKYELKARAASQQETRERITKAAAELHEERGVARTTVAEIARRAEVQRLTVYNHFSELSDLLPACAAHYASRHPFPDLGEAFALADPAKRLRSALGALYLWYRQTESMMGKLFADRSSVPVLDDFMKANLDRQVAELSAALAGGFGARGRRAERVRALTAVAVDFATWRRLDGEGLDDATAAKLMSEAVAAVSS
jgi:AcrR family transcriptional regulator